MTTETTHWLNDLAPTAQTDVLALMRGLRERTNLHYQEAARLSPRYGEIAVGGAHVDELIRAEGYGAFLRSLARGGSPDAARAAGVEEARLTASKWNEHRRRDYQVHRNVELAGSFLDDAWRAVLRAGQGEKSSEKVA